jgi:hypothetical protein
MLNWKVLTISLTKNFKSLIKSGLKSKGVENAAFSTPSSYGDLAKGNSLRNSLDLKPALA